MSTYTSEPGTRLAGRYRLVDQVSAGTGWTMWKAIDETLARAVTVLTFAHGFPRVPDVIAAARAASRLTDPRLAQVFDVEDADGQAYVVMEWLAGDALADLLAEGPLEPARAVALVAEAAGALAAAHAAGQAHLRLGPRSLRWTRSGGVKISGLGIDAALTGGPRASAAAGDPALTDTRDLARLLYAGLTGYWPGEDPGPLPPAPLSDGTFCTPRQVSAEVPAAIDAVTCQALLQRPTRHGAPITTPAAFADALATVAPPLPLPEPAPRTGRGPAAGGYGYGQQAGGHPAAGGGAPGWGGYAAPASPGRGTAYRRRFPATERSVITRAVVGVVIVLVLAAVGATAWLISSGTQKAAPPQAGRRPPGRPSPSTAATVVLKPLSAHSFDAYGNDDGTDENDSQAPNAIDGNPSTFWHTDYYLDYPKFGNLKPGTGLILNMGRQVQLSQVQVLFGSACCTAAQIMVGNSDAQAASTLGSFTTVAQSSTAAGNYTFAASSKATGQYVLIWLTSLPPLQGASGKYEAFIYNIVVRGTAVAGSG